MCPKDYEDFRLFGEILYPFEAVPNDQKVEYKVFAIYFMSVLIHRLINE